MFSFILSGTWSSSVDKNKKTNNCNLEEGQNMKAKKEDRRGSALRETAKGLRERAAKWQITKDMVSV